MSKEALTVTQAEAISERLWSVVIAVEKTRVSLEYCDGCKRAPFRPHKLKAVAACVKMSRWAVRLGALIDGELVALGGHVEQLDHAYQADPSELLSGAWHRETAASLATVRAEAALIRARIARAASERSQLWRAAAAQFPALDLAAELAHIARLSGLEGIDYGAAVELPALDLALSK